MNDPTQTLAGRLATYLTAYKHYIEIYSKAGSPDVAIFGEPLARDMAMIVFGYTDLVSLNLQTSFSSVGLGSPAGACAIQVAVMGTTTNIVETQEAFFAQGFDSTYSRLNFIVLGKKEASYDSERIVRSRGTFSFDPDRDIHDLDDLLGIMVSRADPARLEAFADRLQSELGSPTQPYAS